MKKRILALILTVIVLICISQTAFAYNTNYPNTWVNTGNQAYDIAKIAESQIGYVETGDNHTKYNAWFYGSDKSAGWCAIFISWCANQAGVATSTIKCQASAAKGAFGTPTYNYSSSIKQGDIAYIGSPGGSSSSHVGIVTEVSGGYVYTAEGNYSNKVSKGKFSQSTGKRIGGDNTAILFYGRPNYSESGSSHTTHIKSDYYFYEEVHPHYNYWRCSVCGELFTDGSTEKVLTCSQCNTASIPTNVSVTTNHLYNYSVGETVTIIPSGKNVKFYTMRICYGSYGDDTTVYKDLNGFTGNKTYIPAKAGIYIVRVSAVGKEGYFTDAECNFYVGAGPTNVSVKTNKSTYDLNETVTIIPSGTNVDHYSLRICYGTYGIDTTVYTDFSGLTGNTTYKPTKEGTYIVTISAVNSKGYYTDAQCSFKVEKHTHSYVDTKTAPTCTAEGYTTHTCFVCNDNYKDTYTNALGHNYSTEWTIEIPATETTTGIKSRHCTRCDAKTDVTEIPATGTQNVGKKFSDVKAGSWYEDAVQYAVEHKLFSGVSPTEFAPDVMMTRAMLVTVLWRMEGEPTGSAENPFKDVPSGEWYTDAVKWAAANGIVKGTTEKTFDPDGDITREQMATILHRYAEKKGYDVTKSENLGAFPDGAKTSDYAVSALSWAYAEKLITGVKEGKIDYLDPQGGATRAQVATILMRFGQNVASLQ